MVPGNPHATQYSGVTPIMLGLIPLNPLILGLKPNMDGVQIKTNMTGTALGNPRLPPRPITLTSPDVLGSSQGPQYDGFWKF